MRKLIVVFLFCLLSPIANAETVKISKPVVCNDLKSALAELHGVHGEKIYWVGYEEESESNFVLLVNAKENTWTVIQTKNDVVCMMGSGDNNKFFLGMPLKK